MINSDLLRKIKLGSILEERTSLNRFKNYNEHKALLSSHGSSSSWTFLGETLKTFGQGDVGRSLTEHTRGCMIETGMWISFRYEYSQSLFI